MNPVPARSGYQAPQQPQQQAQDPSLKLVQDQQQQLYARIQAVQKKIADARNGIDVPTDPKAPPNEMGRVLPTQADIDFYINNVLTQQLADAQQAFDDTSAVLLRYRELANKEAGQLTEADRQTLALNQAQLQETIRRNSAELQHGQRQDNIDAARLALEQAKFDQATKADPDGSLARARADAEAKLTAAQTDAQTFDTQTLGPSRQKLIDAQTASQNWDVERGKALLPGEKRLQGTAAAEQEVRTKAYETERQVAEENLRVAKEGPLVTLHRQLTDYIAGASSPQEAAQREREADTAWTTAQSGGSPLDWQAKLNADANTMTANLMQAGMLSSGRGLDPTGAISKALAGVGIAWQEPTPQHVTIPQWAQQAGVNLQAPSYSLNGGAAGGVVPPWAQQGAPRVVDVSGQTWQQIKANAMQAQSAQPLVTTTPSTASLFPGQPVTVVPPAAAAGGSVAVPARALAGRR